MSEPPALQDVRKVGQSLQFNVEGQAYVYDGPGLSVERAAAA